MGFMSDTGWIVSLMTLAGALEVGGIVTIVIEMRRGRRWAREWWERSNPEHPGELTWNMLEGLGPTLGEVLQGGGAVRIWGVALLCAGLVVGVAANIWSVLA